MCLCMTTRVSRHSNVTRRRRPCIKRRTHSSPRSGTRRAWILQPRTSECAKPTCPGYPRRSRPPVRQVKGCRPTKHCENPTRHLQRSREALLRSCRSPGWGIRGRYSECTEHTALSTAAPGCQRPPLRSTTAQATKPACRARSRRRRSEATGRLFRPRKGLLVHFRPLKGLLQGIGGEDPKDHGNTALASHSGNTLADFRHHHIEMGGIPANHRAQGDHHVVAA